MPRIFTGLEIPSDIAASLATLRGGLPARAGSTRRTITLRSFHRRCRLCDRRARFDQRSARCGVRHSRSISTISPPSAADRPRALFAARAEARALTELQAAQERVVQRRGPRAGEPQVHAARNAGPPQGYRAAKSPIISVAAPSLRAISGLAVRAVFARFGRRRTLCCGAGLSAGGVASRGCQRTVDFLCSRPQAVGFR